MSQLLAIKNLTVVLKDDPGRRILDNVSLSVNEGQVVGVVGGSGSGKSSLGYAVLGLLPQAMRGVSGKVLFLNKDVLEKKKDEHGRRYRGGQVAMVFQEPQSAFNPVMRVGAQIAESLVVHCPDLNSRAEEVCRLLEVAGIEDAKRVADAYPHELSGGLRQRAMIAQALSGRPKLLIADEPTSNLDVTHQAKVLELLLSLREKLGLSIVLITHDLGIVKKFADYVIVMNAGKVVEEGGIDVIEKGSMPYTKELASAHEL